MVAIGVSSGGPLIYTELGTAGRCSGSAEGVNVPDLLPKKPTNVIDVVNYLKEAIGDGLDGVQNRYVLSLLPEVGHVPRLVGHSAPGHGTWWESQLRLLPMLRLE